MAKKTKGHLVQINDPNNDVAIRVQSVSKSFVLPHNKQNSLKGTLINLVGRGDRTYETQEVLKDISFEIKKGEFFGIVGRNGSGKSTLLKMLAGIYTPSKGTIIVNGSLTPFIELGVGFNPELTGRENVFLNGALLGFNEKEVEGMYEDIVQFAELERFMDQKLKNYSSGMQVRLAFSIAIRARSDILLLDEVLAVGDEAFQRKCYSYFETLKRNKKTVVLVTHDMAAVERFCTKGFFIEDGEIKVAGGPREIANAYSRSNDESYDPTEINIENEADNKYVKSQIDIVLYKATKATKKFISGDEMIVKLAWPHSGVKHAGVALYKENGEYVFGPNTFQDGSKIINGKKLIYKVKLNLAEGNYFLQAGVFGEDDTITIDFEERGPLFAVSRNRNEPQWGGSVKLDHSWSIEEVHD